MQVITILGPTASGKTRLATKISALIGGEIISADSRQVYRRMNIGTGKDLNEYNVGGAEIPYHLIDISEPGYEYSVFEFQRDFLKTYYNIVKRNYIPVLCGGSGMYIESVILGYNLIEVPVDGNLRDYLAEKSLSELKDILQMYRKQHNSTDLRDKERIVRAIEIQRYYEEHPDQQYDYPKLPFLIMGISMELDVLQQRIRKRLKDRLSHGMVDEVRDLLDSGLTPAQLIHYGLEYKYITMYLTGELNANDMFQKLNAAIYQFARRQLTWFRGMEKKGIKIHWIDGCVSEDKLLLSAMDLIRKNSDSV
jgi:tRNA dimethylallyltransferase